MVIYKIFLCSIYNKPSKYFLLWLFAKQLFHTSGGGHVTELSAYETVVLLWGNKCHEKMSLP